MNKLNKLLVLAGLVFGLAACGSNEDAAPAEQPATTEQQPSVPIDNVFHDQVEALNKAKAAKQAQEQRQEELNQAIEEQTDDTSDNPPRT